MSMFDELRVGCAVSLGHGFLHVLRHLDSCSWPCADALEGLGGVLLDKTASLAAHLLAAAAAHLACVRHAPLPLLLRSGGMQVPSLLRYMEVTPAPLPL